MKSVMVPLAVASDRSESIAFSEQRLINMFPEKSQFGGKSPFVLLWAPALKPWGSGVGTGPWRGGIVMDDVQYVVSGGTMYSVNGAGVGTSLGPIDGSGYVSMATVGTQICVATSEGSGFHYDSLTGTLQQITDVNFFGGTSVAALDGYFIWSSGGAFKTRFQPSALLNGLVYDSIEFASAESTAKLIAIDAQDTETRDVLKLIADKSGQNFLVSDEVPEVYLNADRVLHMAAGRIAHEWDPRQTGLPDMEAAVYA